MMAQLSIDARLVEYDFIVKIFKCQHLIYFRNLICWIEKTVFVIALNLSVWSLKLKYGNVKGLWLPLQSVNSVIPGVASKYTPQLSSKRDKSQIKDEKSSHKIIDVFLLFFLLNLIMWHDLDQHNRFLCKVRKCFWVVIYYPLGINP